MNWINYNQNDKATHPKKCDRYIVRRKDGKEHHETFNGQSWAYNNKVITHYLELEEPKDSHVITKDKVTDLVDYIYEFAALYGQYYHNKDAEAIMNHVAEKIDTPEQFLAKFLP